MLPYYFRLRRFSVRQNHNVVGKSKRGSLLRSFVLESGRAGAAPPRAGKSRSCCCWSLPSARKLLGCAAESGRDAALLLFIVFVVGLVRTHPHSISTLLLQTNPYLSTAKLHLPTATVISSDLELKCVERRTKRYYYLMNTQTFWKLVTCVAYST